MSDARLEAATLLQGNLLARGEDLATRGIEPDDVGVEAVDLSFLGPLAGLVGRWEGSLGKNLIAVPRKGTKPDTEGGFELLLQDYKETLTFTAVGVARNRGGDLDQLVGALRYDQVVTATKSNDPSIPVDTVIHVENGMFLFLSPIRINPGYSTPGPESAGTGLAPLPLARSATIPHGNTALLYGDSVTADALPDISPIPFLPTELGQAPAGYTEDYPRDLNLAKILIDDFPAKVAPQTTTFSFDSVNGTSQLTNLPYLVLRAQARRFQSTFWLIQGDKNNPGKDQRLQYAQVIDLEFHRKFKQNGQIDWPHVTVNSLKKVG